MGVGELVADQASTAGRGVLLNAQQRNVLATPHQSPDLRQGVLSFRGGEPLEEPLAAFTFAATKCVPVVLRVTQLGQMAVADARLGERAA